MQRWMKVRMSASSWLIDVSTPRRNCLRVSSANWLIQNADVGLKWTWQCGRRANHDAPARSYWLSS